MFKVSIVAVLLCAAMYSQSMAQKAGNEPVYKTSLDSLRKMKDPLQQEALIIRLEKANPKDSFEWYKYLLAYNFAAAKNISKTLAYFRQFKGDVRGMALETIPGLIIKADANAGEALIKEELAKADNTVNERQTLLDLKRQVLEKKGDYKNAFTAMQDYYENIAKKTPVITAGYYNLMSKAGKYKEALSGLEKAVQTGAANEDVKAELKTAWAKINPGKDPQAYFAALIKPLEDKYKAEVKARMVSKAAPDFKVTDVDGNTVSLSDFKGKVVVLDFWAIWCEPCKRGLPAMQMAVDRYKADPDVKFLFIHTFETAPDSRVEAMKYLAANNFSLPLYMDKKYAGVNPAAAAFGIKAIPAKFVIDKQGRIRFLAAGSAETDEATANQLSAMIELARS